MPWKDLIPAPEDGRKKEALSEASFVNASGDIDYKVNAVSRHPWYVSIVEGKIRCYKGCIWGTNKGTDTRKTHIRQTGTARSKIKITGSKVGSTGSDYVAAGVQSDGEQIAWPPTYDSAGGVASTPRNPESKDYGILWNTNGKEIGYEGFKTGYDSMPWFEWNLVVSQLWLKGKKDAEGKLQWGLFLEGSAPPTDGQYAMLVATVEADGTVLQYLKSDLFVPDDPSVSVDHPFKVTSVDGEITVSAGTVNNIIVDSGLYEGGGTTYVYLSWEFDMDTDEPLSDPEVNTYASVKAVDDQFFYLLIAEVVGDEVHQFVTGSLWVDRMRMGDQPALYYVARI